MSEPTRELRPQDPLSFYAISEDEKLSALRKYQLVNLGNRSLWALAKYEFMLLFCNDLPGMLGLFLRQKLYGLMLGKLGRKVMLGRGITWRQPGKVTIEDGAAIDDYCMFKIRGSDESSITVGKNAFIGRNTYLNTRGGRVEIRDHANISSQVRIGTYDRVVIGSYAIVSAFCYIGGLNHRTDRTDLPMALQGIDQRGGVVIEDDVWIGAGTVVTDGVTIGRGSIIGAGSVVNRDIPPWSVAVGVPARVIKKRLPPADQTPATPEQRKD